MNTSSKSTMEWFEREVKVKLGKECYENITIFPILWNIYEREYWSTNFNIDKISENISELSNCYLELNEEIVLIYKKIERYREIRGFSIEQHFYGLSPLSEKYLNDFQKKSNSNSIEDKLWIIIWLTYRVRCNMFHGSKELLDFAEMKSQILQFEEINTFLVFCIKSKVKIY